MLLISTSLNGQNFEGKIMYSINYKSKSKNTSDKQLNNLMGTRQAYVIKKGNYKSAFNGKFIRLQMYRSDENRNYSLTAKSDTLYYEDYSINKDKALHFEIKKNQDTIMAVSYTHLTLPTTPYV